MYKSRKNVLVEVIITSFVQNCNI